MPLDQWRYYRLVKLTGWSDDTILNTSAVRMDWLLACEDAERSAEAAAQERANRKAGSG